MLPEAHASVYYDGSVRWRKTGILTGTCELTGVTSFPFDTTSCYFDFGDDRDPLFHRINYNYVAPQFFSSLQDNKWNFQEYRMLTSRTFVEEVTESLSGFENRFIRYRFYFDRAEKFYVHMFVIVYMLFSYLSFGTFWIDAESGDRLGFGTSILFLMVAQDISSADVTPVTQEFLWIRKLSLASKLLVLFTIIHSIVAMWILTKDFDGEDGSQEEREHFIETFEEKEPSRARSFNKLVFDRYCQAGNVFARIEIKEGDSKRLKREKKVRMADVTSFVLCFVAYTILVIILLTTIN
mmetsp:Transcript_34053/g.49888  ORF Transcript_34053/g.49888 Transcript_34053/m.49888 type:complete len:295 (+) Transcript_34053:449-1333(+)